MSKAVPLDHQFDQCRFTELLRKAMGGRSQADFASDCDLSPAYVSRYLNGHVKNPPTPSTLMKIARSADGRVSYAELLQVAGYDPNKYAVAVSKQQRNQVESTISILRNRLLDTDLVIRGTQTDKERLFDLSVTLYDSILSRWDFDYIISSRNWPSPEPRFFARIYDTYGRLVTNHAFSTEICKFSFVTDSRKDFQTLLNFPAYNLHMIVSAILVDSKKKVVEAENLLPSEGASHYEPSDIPVLAPPASIVDEADASEHQSTNK